MFWHSQPDYSKKGDSFSKQEEKEEKKSANRFRLKKLNVDDALTTDDAGLKMSQITMTTDDLAKILAAVQVGASMPGKPSEGQESISAGVTIDHQRGFFWTLFSFFPPKMNHVLSPRAGRTFPVSGQASISATEYYSFVRDVRFVVFDPTWIFLRVTCTLLYSRMMSLLRTSMGECQVL